jgi:hypothetical protein
VGLRLIQVANISSAIGMVGYRPLMEVHSMPQTHCVFLVLSGHLKRDSRNWLCACGETPQQLPTTKLQWGVLFCLDVVASGLSYFI